MPKTLRGIYHNLKESEYTISNSEVVFFFSSELYLNKFMDGYKENRKKYQNKFNKNHETQLNFNTLYDILLYKEIEKRGFRVTLNGMEIGYASLEKYALRKMMDENTLDWKRIERPSVKQRIYGLKSACMIIDEIGG